MTDMLGVRRALLIDGWLAAGEHTAVLDATSLTSGVYFYSLEAAGEVVTKMMQVIK